MGNTVGNDVGVIPGGNHQVELLGYHAVAHCSDLQFYIAVLLEQLHVVDVCGHIGHQAVHKEGQHRPHGVGSGLVKQRECHFLQLWLRCFRCRGFHFALRFHRRGNFRLLRCFRGRFACLGFRGRRGFGCRRGRTASASRQECCQQGQYQQQGYPTFPFHPAFSFLRSIHLTLPHTGFNGFIIFLFRVICNSISIFIHSVRE